MADQPTGAARPMAWWGVIQAAVREHATTAEVWQAIRDYGARHEVTYPPGMFQAVNSIRGAAAGLRTSSDRLTRAPDENAITGNLVGGLPYARDPTAQALVRQFHVRVEYTAVRGLETESSYITVPYSGSLPETVGELRADAEVAAAASVEGYGAALVSVDRLEIGEW